MDKYRKQKCDDCGFRILIDCKAKTSEGVRGDDRFCLPLNCADCGTVIGHYCDDCLEDLAGWLCDSCQ